MTAADREAAARRQRAQEIALWRWTLVEPAMDPALTARQRGQVVRDLASREHEGPDGKRKVPVSRRTLDRWVVARRDGGFEALVPEPRQCPPRTDEEIVDLAVGLKMENPARTAAQVRRILIARLGPAQVPSERAIQRWFAARELNTRPDGRPPEAFGRFEAGAVNEIWTADLMNGPVIGGRDCHLSVIIDDRSRFLTGGPVRPPPGRVPVRRRAPRRDRHPRHPAVSVLRQRLVLCRHVAAADLRGARHQADPQRAGTPDGPGQGRARDRDDPAAVHGRGHRRRARIPPGTRCRRWRSSTACSRRGSAPSTTPGSTPRPGKPRRPAGMRPARSPLPDPGRLRHAFAWSEVRLVRKTATVELEGNVYSVDPFLAGRKVELVFDPSDMTELDVYWQGRKAGKAVPQVIGRHAHPKAPPDEDDPPAREADRHRLPRGSSPTPTAPPWPAGSACRPSTTATPAPAAGRREGGAA